MTDRVPRRRPSDTGWVFWWRDGDLEWELEWLETKRAWVRRLAVADGGWSAYPVDLPEPDSEDHAQTIVDQHAEGEL